MSFKYTPATLRKMEELFDEAHYSIRYEKGNFNSGYCILEDRRVVVINRFLPTEGRINALMEILPGLPIDKSTLSENSLKWYQQILPNKPEGDKEETEEEE